MKRQTVRFVALALAAVVMAGCGSPIALFDDVRRLVVPPGSLDESFGGDGIVVTPIGASGDIGYAVAIQNDGKIVVAGYTGGGSYQEFAVVRYTKSGALDATFGTAGKVTTQIGSNDSIGYTVGIQNDGKIVVAGYSHNGSDGDFAVARYTATGALDSSFGTGGKVVTDFGSGNDTAKALAIQNDGIIVAGFAQVGARYDFALVRYTNSGALDTDFGTGGKVTTQIGSNDSMGYAVGIQDDGKIVVAGYSYNGSDGDFAVARYTATGALDSSFGTGGKVVTDFGSGSDTAKALTIQNDGNIVVAGLAHIAARYGFALARYTTGGALDTDFGTGGIVTTAHGAIEDQAYAVSLQTDGKIVVAGQTSSGANSDAALMRHTSTGALDSSFGTGGIVTTDLGSDTDCANALAIQDDGKIVVAGQGRLSGYDGFAVLRYMP